VQRTCGADGTWVEAACDLACDGAGSKCVVPVQLVGGEFHVCVRLSDQTARCWGTGSTGQLGNGRGANGEGATQLMPKPVANLVGVTNLVAGRESTCAYLADGTVSCWGANDSNQLQAFDGNVFTPAQVSLPTPGGEPNPIAVVSPGRAHTCAINDKSQTYCKGVNLSGELGNGEAQTAGTDVFASIINPAEVTLKQVFSLDYATFAVDEVGDLYCWGDNANGLCVKGQAVQRVPLPQKFDSNGPLPGDKVEQVRTVSAFFRYDDGVRYGSACAVSVDGQLRCWGSNLLGQLGIGGGTADASMATFNAARRPLVGESLIRSVSMGPLHACAVTDDNQLLCWGENSTNQLGVACGPDLSCDAGQVFGGSVYYGVPHRVQLDQVLETHAGLGFTCALTGNAKVFCWGNNSKAALGINKTYDELPMTATPTPVVWKLRARRSGPEPLRPPLRARAAAPAAQGPSRFARSTTVPGLAAVAASKAAKPTK
jgi:alpha-tubulin suppressor-like RCC1 family protein